MQVGSHGVPKMQILDFKRWKPKSKARTKSWITPWKLTQCQNFSGFSKLRVFAPHWCFSPAPEIPLFDNIPVARLKNLLFWGFSDFLTRCAPAVHSNRIPTIVEVIYERQLSKNSIRHGFLGAFWTLLGRTQTEHFSNFAVFRISEIHFRVQDVPRTQNFSGIWWLMGIPTYVSQQNFENVRRIDNITSARSTHTRCVKMSWIFANKRNSWIFILIEMAISKLFWLFVVTECKWWILTLIDRTRAMKLL